MAREGDVIENPVSGARIVFRKTARNTNGELLQFDLFFKRHLIGGARLIHPRQEMRFEVVSGMVRSPVGGKEQSLSAGQVVVVPPGVPHSFRNDGDEEAHVLVDFRPALKLETFLQIRMTFCPPTPPDEGLPTYCRPRSWLASMSSFSLGRR